MEIRLTGKLERDDYAQFVAPIERLIKNRGKLRLLVVMHDFHGWDAGALWEDIKFDVRHFADIERLGLVGETAWQHWMAAFCKPFTTAAVRFFDSAQIDEARRWVGGEA